LNFTWLQDLTGLAPTEFTGNRLPESRLPERSRALGSDVTPLGR
jgi:hypothetical protein